MLAKRESSSSMLKNPFITVICNTFLVVFVAVCLESNKLFLVLFPLVTMYQPVSPICYTMLEYLSLQKMTSLSIVTTAHICPIQ